VHSDVDYCLLCLFRQWA